jgi:membrane protease YdiL (CAAX protease family)
MIASFSPTLPDSMSHAAIAAGLMILLILGAGLIIDAILLEKWQKSGIPAPAYADRLLARHWHWRDALWLTLVMTVFLAALMLAGTLFKTQIANLTTNGQRTVIVIQNLVTQGLALALVIYLQRRSGHSLAESLGGPAAPISKRVKQALFFYVAAMPLIAAAALLSNILLSTLDLPLQPQPVLGGFIDTTAPLWFKLWLIATAIIAAPVVEETVFRGVFLPALARHRGIPAAVVTVSLLFALIHGHLPSALPLFVVGATLATAYLYTGSLLVPILIHATFNVVNLTALLLSGITYTP